jgi:hypothetical protein
VQKRRQWEKSFGQKNLKFWKHVGFSDESKFMLFGSDGRLYCRRRPGEALAPQNVQPMVKYGGRSVMVWGVITWNGVGCLIRVVGKMNAEQYCNILLEGLLGTLSDQNIGCSHFIFQQDNDPKHTSGRARRWFEENRLKVLPWPPSSPDLNIIEHVWDAIDCAIRRRKHCPLNLDKLWEVIQEEWKNLDIKFIRHLYHSLPHCLAALKAARGQHTKY